MLLDIYSHTQFICTHMYIYILTYLYLYSELFRMVTMHLGRIKQSHIEGFSNGSFGLTKQFSEVIGQAVCQHSFPSCPCGDSQSASLQTSPGVGETAPPPSGSWNKVGCWSHPWLLPTNCHLCSSVSVM